MKEETPENYQIPKALVVDDDDLQRELMTKSLELIGIHYVTARDAFEAIDVFHKEKPDIIITDLQMPRKNGLELAVEIQKFKPDIPVILVTGSVFEKSDIEQYGAKIYKTIKKPFRLEEVNHAVMEALKSNGTFFQHRIE